MQEDYKYYLTIDIDASGLYVFYIKDYFGNSFVSWDGTSGTKIDITDISKRNVLIDYTNADLLTIMKASLQLSTGDNVFGGGIVEIKYDASNQVMFVNLVKDNATINGEIFTRTLIAEGVYYCKGSADPNCENDVEDIRKSAISDSEINFVKYWKVDGTADPDVAANKSVSGSAVSHGTYVQGNSFINIGFNATGQKNRVEVSVTDNGRYRFVVEDKFGNTTDKIMGSEGEIADHKYRNPYVDVTIIDRTAPEVETTGDNSINSYDYVKGGGEVSPEVDLIADEDNTTVYYNNKGTKLFDYQDAITIAGITAKDLSGVDGYKVTFNADNLGSYSDSGSSLKSDRNTAGTSTVISSSTLHDYILKNNIVSFASGLVVPNLTVGITGGAFELGGVTYTINYSKDNGRGNAATDKPASLSYSGGTDIAISDGRVFTISGKQYIISGNRIVSYGSGLTKTSVVGTNYTVTNDDADSYLLTEGTLTTAVGTGVDFVSAFDGPSYTNKYMGFVQISFYDVSDTDFSDPICSLGLSDTDNSACFKEINKYIDSVQNFVMRFRVEDYVGNVSGYKNITVSIVDNTAPGYLPSFVGQNTDPDGSRRTKWSNVFANSGCMLEIGNKIQPKATLVNCYLIGANATTNSAVYYFKDNDTNYKTAADTTTDTQLYELSGKTNYYDSILIQIENDAGEFKTVTDDASTNATLSKAGQHQLKIVISDNWSTKNTLTVFVEYFVNPRTLLIEPIANSKVYGEADPTFDYCVYINTDNTTFSSTGRFFDLDFVEQYFKLAYCTMSGRTAQLAGITDITKQENVLLNGDKFGGALSRVESLWYNNEISSISNTHNNYVGWYRIVLGDLKIGTCGTNGVTTCNDDYVIKINPKYLINDVANGSDKSPIKGTTQLGSVQEQNKEFEKDDLPQTESNVEFTIKQAIITIEANGSEKTYGEQDTNSYKWNDSTTPINAASATGYLGGYTLTGLKNDSSKYYFDTIEVANTIKQSIVLGTLRREVGEKVGIYKICNIATDDLRSISEACVSTYVPGNPTEGNYATVNGRIYNYAAYGVYGVGGAELASGDKATLMVNTNGNIYGDVSGKTLNKGERNYVIHYVADDFVIKANELIVQPGINQGKEYSNTEYYDPIWEIVDYGEAEANIIASESGFSGYTETVSSYSDTEITIAKYQTVTSGISIDTDIYYSRRKTSPDIDYVYKLDITLTKEGGNYTNVYTYDGSKYYTLTKTATAVGNYVYAYGSYHKIESVSSDKVTISIEGNLVNQTYTLFEKNGGGAGSAELTRTAGKAVDWYQFNSINNKSNNFKVVSNGNNVCKIEDASISVDGSGENCRNYNLTFETSAPDEHYDASGKSLTDNASDKILAKAVTIKGTNSEYKPDGLHGCNSDGNTVYTSQCSAGIKDKVLFEIFKREIVISFDANKYIFVYGQRYDYYDTDKENGILKVYDKNDAGNTSGKNSEMDIFICYNEYHVAVTCTNDASNTMTYDYGVTAGDTWTNIGLKFYMHSSISATSSAFYDTGSDYAIPAGEYYIYAEISDAAKANYKFTYLGGTLTIIPKVTSVQLTSYTMEYKDGGYNNRAADKYHSYGLGSDYTSFTAYSTKCMLDSEYLKVEAENSVSLINITNCLNVNNEVGNTYGFTIEGLDSKDTIAGNFIGRPKRDSGDNVGYYKINVGSIKALAYKASPLANVTTTYTCETFNSADGFSTDCIYVKGSEQPNYNITYSLDNNEGGYLFITPATIDISDQTKMYGCAYSSYNTNPTTYTINGGYANCDITSTAPSADISYQYVVNGDKDYNNSYTVTGDLAAGNSISSLEGSLYRVDHTNSTIPYRDVYSNSKNDIFQGQSVGTYIITLGDLNSKTNGNSMCDAFNNPTINGGYACRNYNLNYYGNSAANGVTDAASNSTNNENINHKYTVEVANAKISDLATYDLNYVKVNSGETGRYVLMNGKYISLTELTTYTN